MVTKKRPLLGEERPGIRDVPWQEGITIAATPIRVQEKSDCTIATIAKNSREEIRISLRSSMGRRYVAIQVYASNGVDLASKHGLAIKPDLLRQVIDALTRAEAALNAEGLL
jgi:hypothetical protein